MYVSDDDTDIRKLYFYDQLSTVFLKINGNKDISILKDQTLRLGKKRMTLLLEDTAKEE